MAAGLTYEPIATTTLTSTQTEVNFTSISQGYTDLVVVCSGSTTSANSLYMQVGNGTIDTGANYTATRLIGSGTATSTDRLNNTNNWYISTGNFTDSNSIIQIQNYSNTTTFKTALARQNMPNSFVNLTVHMWRSTSAINTIKIYPASSTLTVGSTFTLYGIAAA
jgi:hypothetical protein